MTYFSDQSSYSYIDEYSNEKTLNIGWLDIEHSFEKEEPDDNILALLWEFCLFSVMQTRGLHECNLCNLECTVVEEKDGVRLSLGSAEIRVFGESGIVYSAPNLIYHYVKVHKYKLPNAFLNALEFSPRPTTSKYSQRIKDIALEFSDTHRASSNNERFSLF